MEDLLPLEPTYQQALKIILSLKSHLPVFYIEHLSVLSEPGFNDLYLPHTALPVVEDDDEKEDTKNEILTAPPYKDPLVLDSFSYASLSVDMRAALMELNEPLAQIFVKNSTEFSFDSLMKKKERMETISAGCPGSCKVNNMMYYK